MSKIYSVPGLSGYEEQEAGKLIEKQLNMKVAELDAEFENHDCTFTTHGYCGICNQILMQQINIAKQLNSMIYIDTPVKFQDKKEYIQ